MHRDPQPVSVGQLQLDCREAVTVTRLSVTIAGLMSFSVESCGWAVLANNSIESDNVGCDCCREFDNGSDDLRLGRRS